MDFKSVLNEVVQSVEGTIGIGLVGLDGIAIEQISVKDDFDITTVGAEYSSIIKSAQKASRDFGLGKTLEILITTEKATMIMMTVGDSYFLALAVTIEGNLGRGRLEMKKTIPKLAGELG